ncbi:AzlC family ABC transporter permease [Metabacillus sp. KIGAM252]|uniref:AzlC family ABC transporter permease n=1 Tax=Metabacillus flavus TaxID=2823519 RepID=A0ABS5LCM4_9BACI|nr:AzlC family ABC transporter permease [Metabacillus flavus]MBS2968283.1 AzlC family ABC transporter permease [Metabacillus flavus]
MQPAAAYERKSSFGEGMQAGISIAVGYMPVALTFGLIAKSTGLSLGEAVMMSLFVFAGAAQYISLNLIAAGTGAFEIVFTTFIMNIRHFLMAASLNERAEDAPSWKKALYAFGITDETFSVASLKQGRLTAGYLFGLIFISYSSWVVFTGIGHWAGNLLPVLLQESMSIALYALFIGLLVPSLKGQRKVMVLAASAAVINTLFVLSGYLSAGWSIVLATLISSVGIELIWRGRKEEASIE